MLISLPSETVEGILRGWEATKKPFLAIRHTGGMAKTRTGLNRDAKVDEILDIAERRLRAGGYGELSVVAIARELGLAQNAVYWYFPSKDHLFVATLERIYRGIVARKPPQRRSLERQVVWFVEQLAEVAHVLAAMYERARVSAVVAEFVSRLTETRRQMLTNVLRDRVPDRELPLAVEVLLSTINGVLAEDMPAAERARIVKFAVARVAT
jgi:AcrR family transcriptional regulator